MMKKLDDYIKVYDGVLSSSVCEYLTLTFETSKNKESVTDEVMDFTQLNINQHHSTFVPNLVSATREVIKMYQQDVPETQYFPLNTLALEEFRIKCYNPNTGQQFKRHVDVGDHSSARRYLAFLFYLNTVTEGGATTFDGMTIKPKRGSVLVFPPLWMFPHSGKETYSDSKFIMSTYLHYT